jgi:hypothetical protein
MENQERKTVREDNEVDLGNVFNAISRFFAKLGRFLANVSMAIVSSFILLLLFLKKKIIWLVLAALIGFAYGAYTNYSRGSNYYSTMIARLNFGSSRSLYNSIDYLNALISQGRLKELSQLLKISEQEAGKLVFFEARPVEDELSIIELYKQQFLDYNRSSTLRTDTFWTRTVTYKDFKKSLTNYDMPVQEVTAIGRQPDVFPKLQPAFINLIASNGILKRNSEINQRIKVEEENILVSSLQGLDTLRTVYNKRLREQPGGTGQSTNLTVLDQAQSKPNPELALYDKVLELKDELNAVRKDMVNNQEIIQVYASFNPVGRKLSIFRQSAIQYTYQALVLALVILLLIELYKALNNYERNRKDGTLLS